MTSLEQRPNQTPRKPEATRFENRGRRVERAFQVALLISYPFVMWFGFVILRFWPSLIGFTVVWVVLFLHAQYPTCEPRTVAFDNTKLVAIYRKGAKELQYDDIVRIMWVKDFVGGGITLWAKNGDVVVLAGLDKELTDEVLRRVKSARPDVGWGSHDSGQTYSSWGVVADHEHKDKPWRLTWLKSFDFDHFFWGRRPKKEENVSPHVLNPQHGVVRQSNGNKQSRKERHS